MAASDPSVPPPLALTGRWWGVPVAGWAERPLSALLLSPWSAVLRSQPCPPSTSTTGPSRGSTNPPPSSALAGYVGGRAVPEVPVEVSVRGLIGVTAVGRWGTGTVRRLGSGHYQARVTISGRRVALGTFATRREATAAISNATTAGVGPSRPADRLSLDAWAERWWATRVGHRPTTRARDRGVLDHHILPAFAGRRLDQVTASDVQDWVNQLAAHLAPSTVRRSYTILDQLLESAVDAGLLAAAPNARTRLPRRERYEARFLTATELEHLAATIRPPWRAMVLTLAYATLRIGEAAGLRRADIDVEAGTLRVASSVVEVGGKLIEGPPKTAAGRRTMTMPASVMGELEDHLARYAGPTHVFCASQGGLLRPDTWRSLVWRPAVRKAALRPLRIHDLKHTGVALLAAAGVDPSEISRRAGHSSVAFTYDRYGHLFPEVDKAAGAKLDDLRARAISTESGRKVARPAESAEGLPRVQAADLHEGSARLACEGLGSAHT